MALHALNPDVALKRASCLRCAQGVLRLRVCRVPLCEQCLPSLLVYFAYVYCLLQCSLFPFLSPGLAVSDDVPPTVSLASKNRPTFIFTTALRLCAVALRTHPHFLANELLDLVRDSDFLRTLEHMNVKPRVVPRGPLE